MKVLVVGLGSMGKRRIRCLLALGYDPCAIAGFDVRDDRRAESASNYGIATYASIEEAMTHKPDLLIISVPPDLHHLYMKKAIHLKLPFFVEASVVDTDMKEIITLCRQADVVGAPSSTMVFHPGIRIIRNLIREGGLGTVSNVLYHSGQYLPDWHTYESVRDYYVSNPTTGGAREIVPFELSWLVDIWGFPEQVAGFFRKTINIEGAEDISDTYNALLDYGSLVVNLTVDVVSRIATRRLLINGDKGQLRWDWDENYIQVFNPQRDAWSRIEYSTGKAQPGYNDNIGEDMYVYELAAFFAAVRGEVPFVNTLEKDHKVLQMLYAIEQSDKLSRMIPLYFGGRP